MLLLDRKPLEGGRNAAAAKFLEEIRARLPDGNFSNVHKAPLFKSGYSARFDSLQEAVAITFERR